MAQPQITIDQKSLTEAGFTKSGADHYTNAVTEYAKTLYDKSITYADVDKAPNADHEVTHDHVKAGAYSIANSYGKKRTSKWTVISQAGQFVCAGIVPLSAEHLDKTEGLVGFISSFAVGMILFTMEKLKSNDRR
jgi:hypothetical protein